MPWVAPVLRSTQGDGNNDNSTYSRAFTVQANAGDLVVLSIVCSDYKLIYTGASGGGINFVVNATREKATGYGGAYVVSGVSPTTQTFTLTVNFQNYVNATLYYHHLRVHVFGSHGGVGYAGAWRAGGEPWMTVNQTTEKSAYVSSILDWNATAPNGNWLVEAGPISWGYVFRGGAAIYWTFTHLDSTGLNNKNIGVNGTSSTKLVQAGLEVRGIYVDQAPPSAVSSLAATPLNATQIRVDWGAATDDIGVTAYRVYDYGVQIAEVASNVFTYTHSGLNPESTHQYTVRARDAAGNLAGVLDSKTVSTFPLSVNKGFLGATKPSLRLGTNLVKKLYVGDTQVWP